MFLIRAQIPFFMLLAAGLCGCSGSSAAVSGKVTADGKEVTGGGIVLAPAGADDALPGKPGMTDIRPDGTYSLRLELAASGPAHRFAVRFTPPPVKSTAATAKNVVIPYQGMVPKQAEVEIKPGMNVIDIELVAGPQK
jgi:hypothetical protein